MVAETTSPKLGTAIWSRIVDDPRFDDLPYKVETNEYGQIVLTPRNVRQSFQMGRLIDQLYDPQMQLGRRGVSFAIETPKGVKVADVVWISEERWAAIPENADSSPVSPELVIEVLSQSNPRKQMDEKRTVYFAAGALEVWTCDADGWMRFYGPAGELPASEMVPSFPQSID